MSRDSEPQGAPVVVVLGEVVGVYGVRGWVKVYAYTRERDGILTYDRWLLKRDQVWQEYARVDGRRQGQGIVAQLAGVDDRDEAAALVGAEIGVYRSELPALPAGEYYWAELEGLRVINVAGVELGVVDHLFETGANDVMVVRGEKEHWIPFVPNVIREVDLAAGTLRVDWDADF